ncbi:MAG TPA: hypothetical protein VJL58_04840 [Pyrinomonadaceae bacterium]|nr:hypothetical protein [Pyrinomonadaceae bacterium]
METEPTAKGLHASRPTKELNMVHTPGKAYEIRYESRPKYLFAYAKGDLSKPETRIACWKEIIERCRGENYDRLLVVQDSPPNKSVSEAFTAASGVVELGVDRLKIAFVDPDPAEFENNKFCEVVATNRGANAKLFLTEGPAREWLVSESVSAFEPGRSAGLESTPLRTTKN